MASIRDAWYVVGISEQIGTEPVQRWLFGEPVVLWREPAGRLAAIRDICPHRNAPLSLGKVEGDRIRCPYHGFEFDRKGVCVRVPGFDPPPRALSVPPYSVAERYGLVWIWAGAGNASEADTLVDWPWDVDAAFHSLHGELIVEAPAALIVDNLMDLTHAHFVHKFAAEVLVHESGPMKTTVEGNVVRYARKVEGARFQNNQSDAERSQDYLEIGGAFHPPAVVITSAFTRSSTTGEIDPVGPHRIFLHGLTPEGPERTRYTYMRSWNLYHSREEVEAAIAEDKEALLEDKAIIEATYQHKKKVGELAVERLIGIDEAAVRARRVYAAFGG